MPLRINEISSTVQLSGEDQKLSEADISKIVAVVLDRIRENDEHQKRVIEERTIRNQASEIEPY
jgi:hypothetical protein